MAPVPRDPTTERWYGQTVDELSAMNRQANEFFKNGKGDEAAALIEKGEPLSSRLLSVPQPTLAATEAASDLDQLYGQMLLSNKNYGWARLLFPEKRGTLETLDATDGGNGQPSQTGGIRHRGMRSPDYRVSRDHI